MGNSRRQEIINAARELYETKGLSRTSVKDITDVVGVTRTLFYRYFPDKQSVTTAVLDDYVADFLEALQYWNAQRKVGNIEHALDSVVKLLKTSLSERDSFRKALTSRENAELYIEFINMVADRIASYIVDTTVQDYAKFHSVEIDHVYETFYVLIVGIVGYLRMHPSVDDAVLKNIIAQTLHMERGVDTVQQPSE